MEHNLVPLQQPEDLGVVMEQLAHGMFLDEI
jgi:hypothetical protein